MERVTKFFRDVRMEFSKVSWPSRLETTVLTVLVIIMIALLTMIIFTYDYAYQNIVRALFDLVR
jgi:preprotein translocase subunit SecE